MPTNKIQPRFSMWLILILLALVLCGAWVGVQKLAVLSVNSFEECQKIKGAITQESYPEVCRLPDGRAFIQVLTPEEQKRLVPAPL